MIEAVHRELDVTLDAARLQRRRIDRVRLSEQCGSILVYESLIYPPTYRSRHAIRRGRPSLGQEVRAEAEVEDAVTHQRRAHHGVHLLLVCWCKRP